MRKREDQEKVILIKVGKQIRIARKARGITQEDMANLCDSQKANLSRIESGQTNTSILTLKRIADVLGMQVAELLTIREE